MAAPVDVPISFKITSSSVWNTFYVPALAGMIYAMPGMETKLHAVMNKEGEFTGLSGHYSGSGFSRMNFGFRSLTQQGFDEWVAKAKAAGTPLDREAYLKLEKPSEAEPVRYFASVENGLFDAVVGLCVAPGQMCVQRDAPHRQDGRCGRRQRGEPPAARLRQPPPGERRRAVRRDLPGLRPAAEESRRAAKGVMPRDQPGEAAGGDTPTGQGTAPPGAVAPRRPN